MLERATAMSGNSNGDWIIALLAVEVISGVYCSSNESLMKYASLVRNASLTQ